MLVTFFADFAATTKTEADLTLAEMAERVCGARAPSKGELPWWKTAVFGPLANPKTKSGSLRWNGNVKWLTGNMVDYDGEQITLEEAAEKLNKAGITGLIYTSPSHTDTAPRWRVVCPYSKSLPPDRHCQMVARLNGLFGGALASESFTLSQAYYFGAVDGNPPPRVIVVDGTSTLDRCDELDETAISKPNGNGRTEHKLGDPEAAIDDLKAALDVIPNPNPSWGLKQDTWIEWNNIGMAIWRASGGSDEGLEAFKDWSRKWATKYDEDETEFRWSHYYESPPDQIGFGTLVFLARQVEPGWTPPSRQKPGNWGEPDMGVLGLHRRPPAAFPLDVFGPWGDWIVRAAEAAACPPDYVAAPLLAAASTLIGHARWAQATPGWVEPPHLWIGVVGDSGTGKSPGAECLIRDVLPEVDRRMIADYPDRLRDWRAAKEFADAAEKRWKEEVRAAEKKNTPPPLPPLVHGGPEPQEPRLRLSDVTIERIAMLLATAAPKGLLITRDELAGWIDGMNAYNPAARAFWIEAYGGRPYTVERVKLSEPIKIPRLAVAVYGGTQPDKLALLMRSADDGLMARLLWTWPEPIPFRLSRATPGALWAISAFDRLRELDLTPRDPPMPVMVALTDAAVAMIEDFGAEMQRCQSKAGGLMRSALGKARGQALRLALVFEYLWWCAEDGMAPPPDAISERAMAAAATLVADYYVPMAERVYGDAAATDRERNATTMARWICAEHPAEVHVRHLQRDVRLPGLRSASDIRAAAEVLVDADWLAHPAPGTDFGTRGRIAYPTNPRIWEGGP
jgi:Protein of unknown function (DUF3987)/Primase C terminal 2 (PriCT-2)